MPVGGDNGEAWDGFSPGWSRTDTTIGEDHFERNVSAGVRLAR